MSFSISSSRTVNFLIFTPSQFSTYKSGGIATYVYRTLSTTVASYSTGAYSSLVLVIENDSSMYTASVTITASYTKYNSGGGGNTVVGGSIGGVIGFLCLCGCCCGIVALIVCASKKRRNTQSVYTHVGAQNAMPQGGFQQPQGVHVPVHAQQNYTQTHYPQPTPGYQQNLYPQTNPYPNQYQV